MNSVTLVACTRACQCHASPVTLCHALSCPVMPCHTLSHPVTLCYALSRPLTPCHTLSRPVTPVEKGKNFVVYRQREAALNRPGDDEGVTSPPLGSLSKKWVRFGSATRSSSKVTVRVTSPCLQKEDRCPQSLVGMSVMQRHGSPHLGYLEQTERPLLPTIAKVWAETDP
eukprot:gene10805-biopygen3045